MKILLVNKFYYHRGGDCTAVFSTEELLKKKGHEVAVFSVKHPQNVPSPWESYFPENIDFSSSGIIGKATAVARIFHSTEVLNQFRRLLSDFKPDIVHLHNIHSYISPVVALEAHKKGIRVVWTMHDYKLICPTYSCLRKGYVCEECFSHKRPVFTHKCMKNSYTASFLAWLEASYWNKKKLSDATNVFISPSKFLKEKMIQGGFSGEQITVLHNFMPENITTTSPINKDEFSYCYVGRLSPEKGVGILLEVAKALPYQLKVIGGGPLQQRYEQRYSAQNIEFTGQLPPEEIYPLVRKSCLLVMPSIWYENNPYSVIEALCMGTPVLGSRIGGLPELIEEGKNGFLFSPENTLEMMEKITKSLLLFTNDYDFEKIAVKAQNKFNAESFYNKLIRIYEGL